MTVYVNIGSNQGDRQALIEQAVALIASSYPEGAVRRSDYVESEPWGFESENAFLNLGLAIDVDVDVDPMATLRLLLDIERRVSNAPHRNADGTYRDRPIDIDLIAIDTLTVDHPDLTLPHPRAALRDFVMVPLRQLAPPSVVSHVLNGA